jgi:hypothetical protein
MITVQESKRRSRAIQRPFLDILDLKEKRVGYPSVIHFEGRLASGPEEICNLFAEFMQRTYTDDVWCPLILAQNTCRTFWCALVHLK